MTAHKIIDTDSHVMEPRDLWTSRMSTKKWGDAVPHVKADPVTGRDWWYVRDQAFLPAAISVFVHRPDTTDPVRWEDASGIQKYDEQHPSCYDGAERIKVLDAGGIRAAVLYPNLGLFNMGRLGTELDPSFQLELTRAYNDFLVDWTSPDPSRFVRIAQIPYWDVDESVKEIERAAGLGFAGICTSATPQDKGLPTMGDPYWDRVWAATQAAGMSVNFHAGTSPLDPVETANRIAVEKGLMLPRLGCAIFLENGLALTDLLFSGVLARFPDLKFVTVESGIGHIPFILEAADYHFQRSRITNRPEMKLLPSEYFHRQVYANYWFEHIEQRHLDAIGEDNILFETDYPHTTCLYGDEVTEQVANLSHLPTGAREKLLWRNAEKLYGLEPVAA